VRKGKSSCIICQAGGGSFCDKKKNPPTLHPKKFLLPAAKRGGTFPLRCLHTLSVRREMEKRRGTATYLMNRTQSSLCLLRPLKGERGPVLTVSIAFHVKNPLPGRAAFLQRSRLKASTSAPPNRSTSCAPTLKTSSRSKKGKTKPGRTDPKEGNRERKRRGISVLYITLGRNRAKGSSVRDSWVSLKLGKERERYSLFGARRKAGNSLRQHVWASRRVGRSTKERTRPKRCCSQVAHGKFPQGGKSARSGRDR